MILICGASGLVGKELCFFLDNMGIDYVGTYNQNKIDKPNMFQVDFSNPNELEEFMLFHKITCCIFCIVERLTDVCENHWNQIKKTNLDLVHNTSYLCNKLNISFIHLSTDYVFDGSKQPNYPESLKNPLQNYGISKLISEYRVLTNCEKACIIRTPVLYSAYSKIHDNAVCLIGKNLMDLRSNRAFKEDNYSIRRPLYIEDLCKFIYDCYEKDYRGIYHFYNPHHKYTKYEICQIIGNYLNLKIDKIVPISHQNVGIAPRPYDTQLMDDKFDIRSYDFKDFHKTIEECFRRFRHPRLDPHNSGEFFICLDLDGTLVDTNMAHYNAYKKVFEKYGRSFLTIEEWNHFILNDNIDHYLRSIFDEKQFLEIKQEKREQLKEESIGFTKNSDLFLNFLIENRYNFCVVTNTNEETVAIFKEKLPLMGEIKQWVYRDDYENPKPNPECYKLAKTRYYKNEPYIVGIEDSRVGYDALKKITDLIYIYNNETVFRNNDCYLFDNFEEIL
jgi:dTDP-4-dehydrorhamnose reductase